MPDEPAPPAHSATSFEEKIEILSYLLDKQGLQVPHSATISPKGNYLAPLSFSQERLWFLDQLEPRNPAYNISQIERLIGRLDVSALKRAIATIVNRHQILRTRFDSLDGCPYQIVREHADRVGDYIGSELRPNDSYLFSLIDLSICPQEATEAEAISIAVHEARKPFDLTYGPLFRVVLVRLAPEDHVFILTVHQLVFDWRSHELFSRELSQLYNANIKGAAALLPELPVQYGDFAVWQRDWIAKHNIEPERAFWKRKLKGVLTNLALPTDRPRPVVQSFQGARRAINLPRTLTEGLKELSRHEGVTLFMSLLATFQILLYRYTGQNDLIVGFPITSRNRLEIENLIGFFVNTLVLRSNVSANVTFRTFVERVRAEATAIFANQNLPYERLVNELQLMRALNHNPLFQVMFIFQTNPVARLELTDIISKPLEIDAGISRFDVTLFLAAGDENISGFFEYSTDLFDRPTIEQMVGHYQTLLAGIIADPDRRISELPILTESERTQMLVEWNYTAADYPKEKCIHELFEERVEKTPDAIAITFADQRLSYRDLNLRANQLAHYLRSLGVGPETVVGVCIERSLEMVVALLGILKAGGAYVPLDPRYPKERLAFMVEDAQVSVIVTQEKFLESVQPSAVSRQRSYVRIDRDWPVIQNKSTENPQVGVDSGNLAYVIYTSGSTGQPKGVQVSHRSVVNCLASIGARVGLSGQDRLLAVTTISFDIAALELYLPLLVGGTVVVASRDEATDGTALMRRVKESSATVMQGTPSSWRMLIDAGWEGSLEFKILCGGESLSSDLAQALLARGKVWNLYGPTETTIWSMIHKVESHEGPVPIGHPIANTQIYILDPNLQPVPIGVHGELYIGGDGLARGYFNRLELTEETFVPNPFSDQPGSRLYRTGDRARYLVDGDIEFLGRVDNQVKIRGHRIELGEIEAALNQHPGVKESVVVAVEDGSSASDNPKLTVAYVVPKQQPRLSVAELRGYLKEKLPDYMIPSLFMPLDVLPLTPNGKVDRSALPPVDGRRPDLIHEFVAPRNEIEEMVAQVWRTVLELERVGVYDNFFDLGGHSLVATRVAARLRGHFNIDLPLRKLFELPTVAELAQYVDDLLHNQNGTKTPPIVPVPRDRKIPASLSQQRLWFLRELNPGSTAYNISSVFSIRGPLNVHALSEALNAVISRHEILRTTFEYVEESLVQNIRPFVEMALPVTVLEILPANVREAKAREVALEEARKPFDLRNGPLLRAQLLRVYEGKHYLLLNVDHTILDGWSMGILFKEVGILYEAFANREQNPLPPMKVQYADYAVWQRESLLGDGLESYMAYWKRQVGSYSSPSLTTDYPRSTQQTTVGVRETLPLSRQLTESLKALSRREGVTMFMTLLAAFKILLSRYTGQEDLVVGSTIAGRNRPEIDGLIGFFINALPLRTDLSGNPSFLELLKRIREVCLGAYTHQELPFEKIVEAVNPSRDLSRNPFFQVMFNMADLSERVLHLHGCEVAKESFLDPEAKFDITLYAPEKDETIELAIVYNADLFSDVRITVMLEQISDLLSQIAEQPRAKIGEYRLVSPSTRAFLPDPTESLDGTWAGPIHAFVADWATRALGRITLVDANEAWTYGELETFSTRLANYLIASGIQPKDIVAIYAHRSAPLVLALLGVLKAGAAFVILDPAYPPARLTTYLRIARPKGWLQMDAAGELPEELANCLETLDLTCRVNLPARKQAAAALLREQPESQPWAVVGANDPAYIAFTSGSTGEPKGVLSRHGPITHFLPWQKEAFDLRETDRFCLLSGLAYNHLQRDIFTALYMGATLYIPDPQIARSPDRLAEWLRRNEITIFHFTPALGQLLLTSGEKTLPSVRRVFFGGDVLTRQEVLKIRELAPHAKIGSFYGATETQRAVGYYEIPEDFSAQGDDGTRAIPLGRGIKDVQLLVLNSAGQLAGVGELGELYMRSPHLAEGYIGDEELTRHRFLINPFTNRPNDRLYRTGELGRYLPDGNVEWAGRNDRCVNIRGFRVELAEIEMVLKQHPTVKNAAVVVRELDDPNPDNLKSKIENPKSATRLVAYVAAEENGPEFIDLLRSFLSERLPDYMVPAHFMILEGLPFSPNGKIDYQALPVPIQYPSSPAGSFDGPQSEIEEKLSKIFAQVLGREKVGLNENFFRLGGHSLLAAQAAARIREVFGVALELRAFFESPVVAALARELDLRLQAGNTIRIRDDTDREEIEL
jgi:amino acid adenylation domain-containing protein